MIKTEETENSNGTELSSHSRQTIADATLGWNRD